MYLNKYLKYKKKYLNLQYGGVKCPSFGFIQHKGECWHDSIMTIIFFSNEIGNLIETFLKNKMNLKIRSGKIDIKSRDEKKLLENVKKNIIEYFKLVKENKTFLMPLCHKFNMSPTLSTKITSLCSCNME